MTETSPIRITLPDVLDAREKRAALQQELRLRYQASVISLTVNMPGDIKYTEDTLSLLYTAVDKLRHLLRQAGAFPLEERILHSPAGPAALFAVRSDAAALKRLGVSLEEEPDHGRLLDVDVFDADGRQLSRGDFGLPPRSCFLCGNMAVACMRANAHQPAEVLEKARHMLLCHRTERTGQLPSEIEIISTAALEAMLLEAVCSPAPGLVDRFNAGAHKDMDIVTFMQSSSSLAPAMRRCALAAWQHTGNSEALLPVLRRIGMEAETTMFQATRGVNTQKGLLFLMGIMTAAASLALKQRAEADIVTATLAQAASLCRGVVARELMPLKEKTPARPLTAGEKLYLAHGVTGIRGEIEAGLPAVTRSGLPTLHKALADGLSLNDALVHTLIALMRETSDTTILNRHSMTVLAQVKQDAGHILGLGGMYTAAGRQAVEELDQSYIRQNISPGGSADLLAVTYFLHMLAERFSSSYDNEKN